MRMVRRGAPLDEPYFKWLIYPLDNKWDETFDLSMLRAMFMTEFKYHVPNDQNRAMDGVYLRDRFLSQVPVKSSANEIENWLELECSVLEMLLALADRASYQTAIGPSDWFSLFVKNLGLRENQSYAKTKRVIQRLINRTYSRDGTGGLFPLENPLEDQREVELWYQMSAYIIENYEGTGV